MIRPKVLLQYQEIKENARKYGGMRAYTANVAHEEDDNGVSTGVQRLIEDRNDVRFKSFQGGAQSSGSAMPITDTPVDGIVVRGE